MKRKLILGTALVFVALLMFSCNKNRFDLDHLESVEGSGQWKLPIGAAHVTLRQVFTQLSQNDLVSYDEDGNLQIAYRFIMDNIIKGSNFMTLGSYEFDAALTLPNGYYEQGVVIHGLVDTTLFFKQKIEIKTDSLSTIESVEIDAGVLSLELNSNMFEIKSCLLSSPDIFIGNDTLASDISDVHLAGASFQMNGGNDSIVLNYAINCTLDSTFLLQPDLVLNTHLQLVDLEIGEIKGHLDEFTYEFRVDTSFVLPLDNFNGDLALVGAKLQIDHKSTFGNLVTQLTIDTAEFYGADAAPSPIFSHFEPIDISYSEDFVSSTEILNFGINTKHNAFRLSGMVDFNPGGLNNLITIDRSSTLGLGIDARIPFRFNIPGVYYLDTFDIDFAKVDVSNFISEVDLHIIFDSELPFNLSAQLYTVDSLTGRVTDSLFVEDFSISASYDGSPVKTETEVAVTHSRLNSLFSAKKVLMRANLNTEGNDVILNLDNGLGLVLKADVIYGGSLEIH